MSYVALYRQWRPQDFENLIGQDHIRATLTNALSSGKIAHAYLFTGPRGTGKTSTAKILAKALNCIHGPTPQPCNQCPNCDKITAGISMDVLEVDAASNRGIDEIRDLRETVKFAPVDGRYKVYIIDEVHMLTTEAFNALLKTLEEPPGHVVFILATTEPHKIPATIHSRCQRYDFRRIALSEIEARLAAVAKGSGLNVEPEALKLVAAHADGGMRDALSILDQCAAIGGDRVTVDDVRGTLGLVGHEWVWRLTDAIANRNTIDALLTLDELIGLGRDVRQILTELVQHARSLLLHLAAPDLALESYTGDKETLSRQGEAFGYTRVSAWISLLHEAINETKWSADPRITAEMALLSACREASDDIQAMSERISRLEQALAAGTSIRVSQSPSLTPVSPAQEIPQPKPTAPKAAIKQTPVAPAAPASGTAPAKGVWDAVLRELINGGKRMVHACVSQGHLESLDDKLAIIRFSVPFSKERTEKDDYRAIIEQALLKITGHSVHIQCILNEEKSQAAIVASTQPKAIDEPPPIVKQAQEIFGGKVIKLEKE
ncbi:DNA polymerase III subunit gamma/tau [Anaerosporomusa subterranea]|uniref:DNA-directed DNA polymerase n=1 Tax=Anaerosporomusa subterranea TaxID=1794912 RepID=A0A154BV87_ANASB|nr:DNA polymerase III subunit gamma/tau [Anaerosporomusa subterranea]KYZ77775.1 DNA polymerase III subunit gamma/tau [Anaerosporomusa subterranea]